jgi:AAA+ superfamily predicted ATPase
MTSTSELFDDVESLPDPRIARRYAALVGLDDIKATLLKESAVLINPERLRRWSVKCHGCEVAAVDAFRERRPLFIFAGDVGSGKTELAETFGDALAQQEQIDVLAFRLSLSARGTGAVGEMTSLISAAFDSVAREIPTSEATPTIAGVLIIDEADALAQSRALAQMHHEDRAGVNALIRKIDGVSANGRPVITILCTNRLDAIDPAIRRRAAAELPFGRPTKEQRRAVLTAALAGTGIREANIENLAAITGASEERDYGYTYSDLRMRIIPAAVLAAYPDKPLTADLVARQIDANPPTPPFGA